MKARYTQSWLNGKNIFMHRKVWIQHFGEIPKGCVIHHIDEDKYNNDIDNLALMTAAGHCRHHALGRPAWNKGMKYGETEGYKKGNKIRNENYNKLCIKTLKEFNNGTETQRAMAERYGVTSRTICNQVKRGREILRESDSERIQETAL